MGHKNDYPLGELYYEEGLTRFLELVEKKSKFNEVRGLSAVPEGIAIEAIFVGMNRRDQTRVLDYLRRSMEVQPAEAFYTEMEIGPIEAEVLQVFHDKRARLRILDKQFMRMAGVKLDGDYRVDAKPYEPGPEPSIEGRTYAYRLKDK